MGLGDNIMASGMARGAAARGKRIAFGDGRRILWDHNSEPIFRGNPNVAAPGSEGAGDLEWIAYFKGSRIYNRQGDRRWIWNPDFRPVPGEVFMTADEMRRAAVHGSGFIVLEPHIEEWKTLAPNKDWGRARYQAVADRLRNEGFRLVQYAYPKAGPPLAGVETILTGSFRDALAVMSSAALYLGAEGGLHHGAAAFGKPAVVLFGGFVPPAVTGYDFHTNLTGGAEACGSFDPCPHCRAAMDAIDVDEVVDAALEHLRA